LDRFDREALAPAPDPAWMGWQHAILYLGLDEFKDRVRRGWEAGRIGFWRQTDRDDWLEGFQQATAGTDRPAAIDDEIAPIDDPVAALAWRWQWVDDPD